MLKKFLQTNQLMCMRLFFSFFLIAFYASGLLSEEHIAQYNIKTKGVFIGEVFWSLNIDNKKFESSVKLKSKGLVGRLFSFNGNYTSLGFIEGGELVCSKYDQKWKTKKKYRDVKLIFKNKKISKLIIEPKETERQRLDYSNLNNYCDPLTSFANILLHKKAFNTIDGRRAYVLSPQKLQEGVRVLIKNYTNIWADHKRNDLEYIEFVVQEKILLPTKIKIMFKGSLFTLIRD